jgi:hypothetical protein
MAEIAPLLEVASSRSTILYRDNRFSTRRVIVGHLRRAHVSDMSELKSRFYSTHSKGLLVKGATLGWKC